MRSVTQSFLQNDAKNVFSIAETHIKERESFKNYLVNTKNKIKETKNAIYDMKDVDLLKTYLSNFCKQIEDKQSSINSVDANLRSG